MSLRWNGAERPRQGPSRCRPPRCALQGFPPHFPGFTRWVLTIGPRIFSRGGKALPWAGRADRQASSRHP